MKDYLDGSYLDEKNDAGGIHLSGRTSSSTGFTPYESNEAVEVIKERIEELELGEEDEAEETDLLIDFNEYLFETKSSSERKTDHLLNRYSLENSILQGLGHQWRSPSLLDLLDRNHFTGSGWPIRREGNNGEIVASVDQSTVSVEYRPSEDAELGSEANLDSALRQIDVYSDSLTAYRDSVTAERDVNDQAWTEVTRMVEGFSELDQALTTGTDDEFKILENI